jgi:predicted dinucleotide-binding enzyme
MKNIAILGTGEVGQTLASALILDNYPVRVGSRDGSKAAQLDVVLEQDIATGTFKEVAAWGEIIVLAVKGSAAEGLIGELQDEVKQKVVIDVTNPIADDEPEDGVLKFFTTLEDSLGERIQKAAPDAMVVKAWNTVGHTLMIKPEFDSMPTMPICGNDTAAKEQVGDLLQSFGWEVEDMGTIKAARAIEPLTMLWCLPGFLRDEWKHAFKLLKQR